MIGTFARQRTGWLVAGAGAAVAAVYAHSRLTWAGETNSALQTAVTASVLIYPLMCSALAVQSSSLFRGEVAFLERGASRVTRARAGAWWGWSVPYVTCYAVLVLALLVTSAGYGPLQRADLTIPLLGVASLLAWSAVAVAAGSVLPPVLAVPMLMLTSFLVPAYAGSTPGTVASVFTNMSSVDFPPMLEIRSTVIAGQSAWFAGVAGVAVVAFASRWRPWRDGKRPRAAFVLSAALAVGMGAALVASGGTRATERALPVSDAECGGAPIRVCVLPEHRDLLARTVEVVGSMTSGAPAGVLPTTLAETGVAADGLRFTMPNRSSGGGEAALVEEIAFALGDWDVCPAWTAAHSDTWLDRVVWLVAGSGREVDSNDLSPAVRRVLELPDEAQWQWWAAPFSSQECG